MAKALVAVITFVAFLPALGNGFVAWDDDRNFLDNPHYRGLGPAQLAWMVSHLDAHYVPLTWLTLGLDYVLWGMNPAGYHLTSLVLHAANAVLVYAGARRLIAAALPGTSSGALALGSAVAALLFAVHPLRVESVAWATERRDVLCGLFYLLTVLAYLRYCASASRRWYRLSLAFLAAALLSKAMAVTLPVVLLLLDGYPLRRRAWREKLPFFALSLAAGAVALVAQRVAGATSTVAFLGPLERVAIACYSLAFYLWKTLVPRHLSPIYELPARVDAFAPSYVASALAVLALSALAIALRRRWPAFTVVWASYVVTVLRPRPGRTPDRRRPIHLPRPARRRDPRGRRVRPGLASARGASGGGPRRALGRGPRPRVRRARARDRPRRADHQADAGLARLRDALDPRARRGPVGDRPRQARRRAGRAGAARGGDRPLPPGTPDPSRHAGRVQ